MTKHRPRLLQSGEARMNSRMSSLLRMALLLSVAVIFTALFKQNYLEAIEGSQYEFIMFSGCMAVFLLLWVRESFVREKEASLTYKRYFSQQISYMECLIAS